MSNLETPYPKFSQAAVKENLDSVMPYLTSAFCPQQVAFQKLHFYDLLSILCPKLYIPSTINTQMNILLLLFLGRMGHQGGSENLYNLFSLAKQVHIKLDFRVRTKKLINVKVRNCQFWH